MEDTIIKPLFDITDPIEVVRKNASGIYKLPQINIPTMIFKAENDPIIGDAISDQKVLGVRNPNILLAKTKYGGHLGFF